MEESRVQNKLLLSLLFLLLFFFILFLFFNEIGNHIRLPKFKYPFFKKKIVLNVPSVKVGEKKHKKNKYLKGATPIFQGYDIFLF